MKKQILSTLVLLTCLIFPFSLHSQEQQRKKVGVVLSGGGAKGMAHIKALKVIEEAGIPIDYIAGTSMGAIVGGRYAEVGAHFEVVHRIDRHRRADLHTVFELVGLFGVKLVRVVVVGFEFVLCVVEVHPRPVDAELDHAGQRLLVQVVAASGSERCAETGFELLALAEIQFLRNEAQVDILGPPCLGFLSRSGDARQQPGCRD